MGKKPNKFPNDLWVKEEVAKKLKSKYIELNENTIYQNLWDITKMVLKRKFTALSENVIKNKSLKSSYIKNPEKKGKQNKPKASRRK